MLNMNGASALTQHLTMIGKWATISQKMRTKKITILALQEMHLDKEWLMEVRGCYKSSLTIYNSQNPENPMGSAGVAFVLNKALIAPTDLKIHTLVQGRAIGMTIKWVETCDLSIVNVYAPNDKGHQAVFWPKLERGR